MKEDLISVLAVDDELLIRQELEMFPWEDYGYLLVGTAGSGKEALRICREKKPDIVVTDITMPAMSGLELIRELGVRYPSIKTLILTCHEDFGYVKEAIGLGAVDYILKLDLSEKPMIDALEKAGKLVREERGRKRNQEDETRDRIGGMLMPGKDSDCADQEAAGGDPFSGEIFSEQLFSHDRKQDGILGICARGVSGDLSWAADREKLVCVRR